MCLCLVNRKHVYHFPNLVFYVSARLSTITAPGRRHLNYFPFAKEPVSDLSRFSANNHGPRASTMTHPQDSSPFEKLPLELRSRIIYFALPRKFSNEEVVIEWVDKKNRLRQKDICHQPDPVFFNLSLVSKWTRSEGIATLHRDVYYVIQIRATPILQSSDFNLSKSTFRIYAQRLHKFLPCQQFRRCNWRRFNYGSTRHDQVSDVHSMRILDARKATDPPTQSNHALPVHHIRKAV